MDSLFVERENPPHLLLADEHVDVWTLPLEILPALRNRLADYLSSAEQYRASHFHFDLHRNRFITGRGSLRFILGCYLGVDPKLLEFVDGPQGKPSLAPMPKHSPLQFNLAHSDSLGIVAVTRSASVGVDIERICPVPEMNELVERFFAPRENRAFQELPTELKPSAFFNLWTRKEAWLKATGQGIGHHLHQVEVSFLPGEPARLLALPGELQFGEEWSLRDLKIAPGFGAALAVSGREPHVTCRRWDFSQSTDLSNDPSGRSPWGNPTLSRISASRQQGLFAKP